MASPDLSEKFKEQVVKLQQVIDHGQLPEVIFQLGVVSFIAKQQKDKRAIRSAFTYAGEIIVNTLSTRKALIESRFLSIAKKSGIDVIAQEKQLVDTIGIAIKDWYNNIAQHAM